jgi:hypothetical protein
MLLRSLAEDLREDRQPGEKNLFPDEMERLFRGRYAFTHKILAARYVSFVDPNLPDGVFYQLQVERERIDGKSTYSNSSCPTSKPDHRLVRHLNEPDILRRASNTEKFARKVKAGLGLVAVGVAYAASKKVKTLKTRNG